MLVVSVRLPGRRSRQPDMSGVRILLAQPAAIRFVRSGLAPAGWPDPG